MNTEPAAKKNARPSWAAYLAINSSTGALLGAILLVCLGSELWGPFLPNFMRSDLAASILVIALYGSFRDLLEAINYLLGGYIAGRFNTRRGLLLFNALPLVGLLILLFGPMLLGPQSWIVFLAIPFVFVWDSLAGPALLTVVGDSLPPEKRAMAFSLQSLFRRVSRMLAYAINAGLVYFAGVKVGMEWAFGLSFFVVLASLFVQQRFMKTASQDQETIINHPIAVLRGFHPQLKRLLAADIFARLAEGMPRELIILFTMAVFIKALGVEANAAAALFGAMLIVSQVTSAITYLPMGAIASQPGFGKRPYIGLTFIFFASFPAVLAGLGLVAIHAALPYAVVIALMGLAFVFAGMREVGEPARKAMIVDLIPPESKTQSIGIYWSARSVAVMLAPLVGGAIWIGANVATGHDIADPLGPGPVAMLLASSLCGVIGVCYYYARFGK
jgi:MFS family permease